MVIRLLAVSIFSLFLISCSFDAAILESSKNSEPEFNFTLPSISNDNTPTIIIPPFKNVIVRLYLDSNCTQSLGEITTSENQSVSFDANSLIDGFYTFYYQIDNDPLCRTTGVSYQVDTSAPATPSSITLLSPASSPHNSASPILQVSGLQPEDFIEVHTNASCTSKLSEIKAENSTQNINLNLNLDADYDFYVLARDLANNKSNCSSTHVDYFFDSTAPQFSGTINLGSVPQNLTSSPSISWVAATDASGSGVSTYDIELYDQNNILLSIYTNKTSGSTLTGLTLVHGNNYYVKVVANDNANNQSTKLTSSTWTASQAPLVVEALFSNASNWNDWIKIANGTPNNTACAGSEAGTFSDSCFPGFIYKKVATSETACTDLSLLDDLSLFDWTCDDSGGTAIFTGKVKETAKLSDFINITIPSSPTWKGNKVTLYKNAVIVNTSNTTSFYANSVLAAPDSSISTARLSTAGAIYVEDTSSATNGISIEADKISYIVTTNEKHTGLATKNCSASTGEYDNASGMSTYCLIFSGGQKFIYIEGTYQANSSISYNLFTHDTKFSIVRHAHFVDSNYFYLGNSSNILVTYTKTNIPILNNNSVRINYSNMFITNSQYAVFPSSASYIYLSKITTTSSDHGFLSNSFGQYDYSTLTAATAANNNVGIRPGGAYYMNFHNVLSMNNNTGLYFSGGGRHTISQFVSHSNSAYNKYQNSTDSKFTGNFIIASDPYNTTSFVSRIGTVTDFSVVDWFLNASQIFIGWGKDGDPVPSSTAAQGRCLSGNCRQWDYRLKNTDIISYNRSDMYTGLNSTDVAGVYTFPLAANACPVEVEGDNVITDAVCYISGSPNMSYTNESTCTAATGTWMSIKSIATPVSTWLKNAIEINDPFDFGYSPSGDHDGLCETNESCLFTPNFGAYQGHGEIKKCNYNSNGGLSGITIYGYTQNGY